MAVVGLKQEGCSCIVVSNTSFQLQAQQEQQTDGKVHYWSTLAGRLLTVGNSFEAYMDSQPDWQKAQGVESAESTDVQAVVVGEEALTGCSYWEHVA